MSNLELYSLQKISIFLVKLAHCSRKISNLANLDISSFPSLKVKFMVYYIEYYSSLSNLDSSFAWIKVYRRSFYLGNKRPSNLNKIPIVY